ncbi:hemin uptake protein HemP [Blastopirellula marina]|uniref:Hemin uptake protein HemP n=1 Tax=Blastopirellula marina TaxID=124 RepID=A0A2S8GL65_9BACT|nr:hemin uptake protein HemP [Blastopirellula marina]PQO44764.1 hemin uptake protein HemP [Blastopirellula marina]
MNTSPDHPQASTSPSTASEEQSTAPLHRRIIPSQQILAGEKEIWIQHGDAVYRLCETKSGKLILQK